MAERTIVLVSAAILACSSLACGSEDDRSGSDNGSGGGDPASGAGASSSASSGDGGAASGTGTGAAGGGSSAGGSSSSTGGATSGTIYYEEHFETEDDSLIITDLVGEATYLPGSGFSGSNCWQIRLFGDQGNEDHAGWGIPFGPPSLPGADQGGTNTMFVGHMLYVSASLVDKMATQGVGGKMLDNGMFPVQGDPSTRQTVIWGWWDAPDLGFVDTGVTGVVPKLLKGGAGGNYVKQLRPQQFDLRDYGDQWIWLEFEFNAEERYTALWIKTPDGVFSGLPSEPVMQRFADDPAEWQHQYWTEEPYDFTDQGWAYAGTLWGYWDDLGGKPLTENDFVRVDDIYIASGWINPPF